MTSLINDILSLPLWFSIPLGVIYLALLAYFFHILWRYRRKNALALLLTIVALASGQSAWAAEKTVTYTLDGTGGENYVVNLTATASGDATGTYGTSWNFQTDVTASVTLANGIKLSFGSNKSGNAMAWQDDWLQIESLAGTTNGAYVSLSNDGYYIYHITLKDYNDNLITEAWTTEKSYTYRASSIRLKTIVVEYDNYIPFTGAVITGINNVYAVSTEAVAPAPTVTWHGTTLTKGTHYTLSYQNNEAPGTATITVTSKGIFYKGASISKNYTLRWAQTRASPTPSRKPSPPTPSPARTTYSRAGTPRPTAMARPTPTARASRISAPPTAPSSTSTPSGGREAAPAATMPIGATMTTARSASPARAAHPISLWATAPGSNIRTPSPPSTSATASPISVKMLLPNAPSSPPSPAATTLPMSKNLPSITHHGSTPPYQKPPQLPISATLHTVARTS